MKQAPVIEFYALRGAITDAVLGYSWTLRTPTGVVLLEPSGLKGTLRSAVMAFELVAEAFDSHVKFEVREGPGATGAHALLTGGLQ